MKIITMVGVCVFLTFQLNGQSIQNIRASLKEDKVHITYDLISSTDSQKFDVYLYSSVGDYSTPLEAVTGAIGKDIQPGKNKEIVWSPVTEYETFDGNITFEVRAKVILPLIKFSNPKENTSFRRGKTYQLKWDGLDPQKKVELELIRNGVKQKDIGNVSQNDNYTWNIPQDSNPGSGYQIKLTTADNSKTVTSPVFKIGRKIPLVLKIAPVLVIGGIVAAVVGGGSGGGEEPPPTDEALPLAPPPPGN